MKRVGDLIGGGGRGSKRGSGLGQEMQCSGSRPGQLIAQFDSGRLQENVMGVNLMRFVGLFVCLYI